MDHSISQTIGNEKLHEYIQRGQTENVKKYLENYQIDRFILNSRKESAAASALRWEQPEIYELLLKNKFKLQAHESIDEILKLGNAQMEIRERLRIIHKKFSTSPSREHLTALQSKYKLSHNSDEARRHEFHIEIQNAFDNLNEIPWIEPILKIAANVEDLSLTFDFNRPSVEEMAPTKTEWDRGTTYHNEFCIYIGAQKLLTCQRNEVWGTIAHELCHLAMNIVYKNNCKPYHRDNVEKQEFEQIVEVCKNMKHCEDIINRAFFGRTEIQHAELIVRVPHIMAAYKNEPDKLLECWTIFEKLFQFYQNNSLRDINLEYQSMEARKKVRRANEQGGLLLHLKNSKFRLKHNQLDLNASEKVIIFVSNCPQLTLNSIYDQLSSEEAFESSFIFVNIQTLIELAAEAFHLDANIIVIVNCNEDIGNELKAELSHRNMTKRLIFVVTKSFCHESFPISVHKVDVEHHWSQLSTETQNILSEYQITFQGNEMMLKEIFYNNSEALEKISLKDLMAKNNIKVGSATNFSEVEFYIPRKFIQNDHDEYQPDEFFNIFDEESILLLSDGPGHGKTTEFKRISDVLKRKNPSSWIIYLDLKEFVDFYQKNDRSSIGIEDAGKFISEKMLKIKNFEEAAFLEFYSSNRIIFLMDGFDEISPSYKNFVMSLAASITTMTTNKLWIATRNHMEKELSDRFSNPSTFKMKPLSMEDQKTFFENFLKLKILNEDDLSRRLNEIENFLSSINTHTYYSVSNPLLMRMIAEVSIDESSFFSDDSSLFYVYDVFVKKMIENLLKDKGPLPKEEYSKWDVTYRVLHYKYAFQIFYNNEEIEKLDEMFFSEHPVLSLEQIARVGLMSSDSSDKLQFIHQTFAEFLVADFFYKKIFCNKRLAPDEFDMISEFLESILVTSPDRQMIRSFLNDALYEISSIDKKSKIFQNAKKVFDKFCSKDENHEIFHLFIEEGCMNLIRAFSMFVQEDQQLLNKIWVQKENLLGHNILMTSVKYQSLSFLEKLWELAKKMLDKEIIKSLIFLKNDFNENIFFHIHDKNQILDLQFFEFFVINSRELLTNEEVVDAVKKLFSDELITVLLSSKRYGYNFDIKERLNIAQKHVNIDLLSILTSSYISNEGDLLRMEFNQRTQNEIKVFSDDLKLKLGSDKFKEVLLKANSYGSSPIMMAAENGNPDAFTVPWSLVEENFEADKQRELLLQEDDEFLTVLGWATRNENVETFEYVKNIYVRLFDDAKLKEVIQKENIYGDSMFCYAICQNGLRNEKTLEALWNFMMNLFDEHTRKNILLKQNKKEKTIFMRIEKPERRNILSSFIEETFSDVEKCKINFN